MTVESGQTYLLGDAGKEHLRLHDRDTGLYITGIYIGALAGVIGASFGTRGIILDFAQPLVIPLMCLLPSVSYSQPRPRLDQWKVYLREGRVHFDTFATSRRAKLDKIRRVTLLEDTEGHFTGLKVWVEPYFAWYIPKLEGMEGLWKEIEAGLPPGAKVGRATRTQSRVMLTGLSLALATAAAAALLTELFSR